MIEVTVVGAEEVALRLSGAGPRMLARVRAEVESLGLQLLRRVKESQLTGQALSVRSGRLRRSITEETVADSETITSTVGTNVSYGRFWELGYSGAQIVRAHLRQTQHGLHRVRAHQRQVNQAARPFLQPALAVMRDKIRDDLRAVAKGSI